MPPLNGATVKTGATMAPSGGTDLSFSSAGIRNDSNTLNCDSDTDLRTRRQIICRTVEPKVSSGAPNGYTQARAFGTLKFPITLANGEVTVNTVRVEFAFDVETTEAERDEMRIIAAQYLTDTDFDDLFNDLNLN
jgi:hypothetical protein